MMLFSSSSSSCSRCCCVSALVHQPRAINTHENAQQQHTALIRTRVQTPGRRRLLNVRVVSSYAPVAASDNAGERREHLEHLEQCIRETRQHEVLLIGTDANAQLGRSEDGNDPVVGAHGVAADGGSAAQRAAAQALHAMMAAHELCAANTLFHQPHGPHTYHGAENQRPRQIDLWIVRRADARPRASYVPR